MENGFPPRFIDKNIHSKPTKRDLSIAPKKILYMSLEFEGDLASDIMKRRISESLKRTFPVASLRIAFTNRLLLFNNLKDKIPMLTNSMCVYQFTCSCGARYIGRSTRVLSKRVQEHPAWLRKGGSGAIRSAIIEHLVDNDHPISIASAFKVIYKAKSNLPKSLRTRLICIAEALVIETEKSHLCVQKKFVQPLQLSWS
uniref:GIY-YIG domain-containing protein n=1 Tax=Trichobilharzia regenti TaxID=157069 RepID=A0AA85J5R7_TRIRE|nr:unnamed protein product [Trichobilharzia regenti]